MRHIKTLLILLLCARATFAQERMDSIFDVINVKLKAFEKTGSFTRLFVHLDKSIYLHNENIWFAGYVLSSPLGISEHHTLYACLADPVNKKIVASDKFVMSGGLGAGYIFLPDSIPAGNYQFIAFTNTYPQEQAEVVFVQAVKLYASNSAATARPAAPAGNNSPPADSSKLVRIRWYPESGNLVARVKTKVAFEAHTLNGKPIGFTADLLEEGNPISTVRLNETGTGSVEFTPVPGKKYSLRPKTSALSVAEEIQPPVTSTGYHINVTEAVIKDSLVFYVSAKPVVNMVYVMIHDFKREYYFEEVITPASKFKVQVPATALPPGLSTITIFDKDARPVAERTIFNRHAKMFNSSITADSTSYQPRSKVTLRIQTKDASGNAAPAAFSLAAVLKKRIDTLTAPDIAASAYFKEYIKQDVPYSINYASAPEMEMFLLTKCWTKYRWEAPLLTHTPPVAANPLGVKGRVLLKGKTPAKPVEVIVINTRFVQTVLTDEQGSFELPPDIIATDPDWKLSLTVNAKNKDDYSFRFLPLEDSVMESLAGRFATSARTASGEVLAEEIPGFAKAKQLDAVVVKARKNNDRDFSYNLEHGIYQSKNCNDWVCSYNILNCRNHPMGTKPQNGASYYMVNAFQQRISVIYRECKTPESKTPQLLLHRIKGRYYTKEFYVNDFSASTDQDLHSTIFWKPLQRSDKNGVVEVSFFTNDLEGEFICILQGLTEHDIISARTVFRVKSK